MMQLKIRNLVILYGCRQLLGKETILPPRYGGAQCVEVLG